MIRSRRGYSDRCVAGGRGVHAARSARVSHYGLTAVLMRGAPFPKPLQGILTTFRLVYA